MVPSVGENGVLSHNSKAEASVLTRAFGSVSQEEDVSTVPQLKGK